jgi:hypothetical protein
MEARILGTTSVHKTSPACGLMISPCVLKCKNACPGVEQAFRLSLNYGRVPVLRRRRNQQRAKALSIIYSTGGGAIA